MSAKGTIELKIDRFSEFVTAQGLKNQRRLSAPTYIFGLPWKILAYSSSGSIANRKTLSFYLRCNEEDDDPNWSCQASVNLQIVSQQAGVDDRVYAFLMNFTSKNTYDGCSNLISCDVLLDPEEGFIKDDVIILRAHVTADMPQGAQIPKLRAFISSISDPPDGTLIVGSNKISIHKMYLSYYSDYFKAMFRSNFREGREDEIVLEEVGYKDILQLLSVIYPSNAPITDKNLKVVLKLADRFIMPAVFEQCKNVLRISNLNGAQKLFLAQQYNFTDLQVEFAQQCKTIAEAKKLRSEPEYNLLDLETRALILDSITS